MNILILQRMTQCLDGIRIILELACMNQSIEHTACAVFVAFWLVLQFREGRILYGSAKNIIVL